MADVTQNDNDRATAIQIASAHSGASTTIANIEAQAQYTVAQAQVIEVQVNAIDAVSVLSNSADAQVIEITSVANIDASVTFLTAQNSANETTITSNYEAIATRQLASVEAGATRDEAYAQSSALYGETAERVRAASRVSQIRSKESQDQANLTRENVLAEAEASAQEIEGASSARISEIVRSSASTILEIARVALIDAEATLYVATSQAVASGAIATLDASTSVTIATTQAGDRDYESGKQSVATRAEADSRSRLDRSGATQDHDTAITVATTRQLADEYASDGRYSGVLAHEDGTDRRLLRKLQYAQSKFDEVFPYVSGSLAAWRTATAPQSPGLAAYPKAPIRGVLTPRLVQAQANQAYSGSSSSLADGYRQAQAEATGRGLSGNSSFLEAIRSSLVASSVRSGNQAAMSSKFQAASANAERVLASQKLRGQTFTDRNRVALESEAVGIQRQVGLLKAVAEIVSGLS